MDSLKALRSVVEAGIVYKDYAARVLDTKIKVDRYLQMPSHGDAKAKASVSEAMNYYLLASNVWPEKIKFEAGVINFGSSCPRVGKNSMKSDVFSTETGLF